MSSLYMCDNFRYSFGIVKKNFLFSHLYRHIAIEGKRYYTNFDGFVSNFDEMSH